MRFYRIDPERLLHIPFFIIHILIEQMPALDAEAMYTGMVVSSSPNMEEDTRISLINDLNELMEPLQPIRINEPAEFQVIEHNPEKAREYFAALGIRTS